MKKEEEKGSEQVEEGREQKGRLYEITEDKNGKIGRKPGKKGAEIKDERREIESGKSMKNEIEKIINA
jgi:hypothetical protein